MILREISTAEWMAGEGQPGTPLDRGDGEDLQQEGGLTLFNNVLGETETLLKGGGGLKQILGHQCSSRRESQ